MVVKSHGARKGTRGKFRKVSRTTVNMFMRNFEINQKVALITDSASHKGMPFRRFHGLTGKIIGKRGNAYLIEIKDSNKKKMVIVNPEHLRLM